MRQLLNYSSSARIHLLVVLLCGTFLFSSCYREEPSSEIVIGAIASLTGPAAEQGRNWVSGASFAVKEWNESPDRKAPVARLSVEDDGTNASAALHAWKKLTTIDRVSGIIGGTWDFVAAPLYPRALAERIPFITPTNAEEIMGIDPATNGYVYSSAMTLAAEAEAIQKFFALRGVRRIAILFPQLPFGTAHAELVRRIAQENSILVTEEIPFVHDGTFPESIRIPVSRLAAKRVDCVFAVLDIAGLDVLTRERARFKGEYLVLTTQHLDEAYRFSNDPPRYEGVFGVYPAIRDRSFEERFRLSMGASPKVFAAEGYDAALALLTMLSREEQESEVIVEGVSGALRIHRGKRVSIASSHARIVEIRGGEVREYSSESGKLSHATRDSGSS